MSHVIIRVMQEKLISFLSIIEPIHLWLVFVGVLVYTILISAVLIYHWHQFSTQNKIVRLASGLYLTVTAILIFALAFIITIIENL